MKYAQWEASQNEFERSRSVFERALDVDPRSVDLWLRYAEMELKARNVNHARNVYDRAVTLLPRVDTVSLASVSESRACWTRSLMPLPSSTSLFSSLFLLPSFLYLARVATRHARRYGTNTST